MAKKGVRPISQMPLHPLKSGCTEAYTFEEVRHYIIQLKEGGESLRNISQDFYGGMITHGTVQRVIKGIEPKAAKARVALGLPALVPAQACIHCGQVHLAKTCPALTRRKRPDKHSISLAPDVWEWLKRNGNASAEIERMARKEMGK